MLPRGCAACGESNQRMCNLYSVTKGQQAILEFTRAALDTTGNLPSMPAIFPDAMAPVVRNTSDRQRELTMMRWGMPGPPQFSGAPITNIRNTASPHWRRWLSPVNRCLVPATSFSEWEDTKPKKTPVWFARDESRPLFAFAGIWTTWNGRRGTKADPVEGEHNLYGFLTTDANSLVGAIHPKAMPVILTTVEEMDTWMRASWADAMSLQRPVSEESLIIVAKGQKTDGGTVDIS